MNYEDRFKKFNLTPEIQSRYGLNSVHTDVFGIRAQTQQIKTIIHSDRQTAKENKGEVNGELE